MSSNERKQRKSSMFSKLFSKNRSKTSTKSSNSDYSSSANTSAEQMTPNNASSNEITSGSEHIKMLDKASSSASKSDKIPGSTSSVVNEANKTVPVNTQMNIFEESQDYAAQQEALALNLLEEHQKQSALSHKLNQDQRLVIIMQNELRATLKDNKTLERKIKSLESDIRGVCDDIRKETEKDTSSIYSKLQQRFPDLHKRLISANSKAQLSSFIRLTSDYRDILRRAERLAKIKYAGATDETSMSTLSASPNSTSKVFKKPPILRKKIVAKRHHPVSKNTSPEQRSTGTGSIPSPRRPMPGQMDMQDFINVDNLSADHFNDMNRLFMSDNLQNRINLMISRFGREGGLESDV